MELLEKSNYSAFYENNQNIIKSILFLETLEEFLDFSKENDLDKECYCAAFLCAHGYGIQIGGYEDDLTHTLTEFFHTQGMEYPEISEIVCKEKIYTDCSDCEYTILKLDKAFADKMLSSWISENFEIYL